MTSSQRPAPRRARHPGAAGFPRTPVGVRGHDNACSSTSALAGQRRGVLHGQPWAKARIQEGRDGHLTGVSTYRRSGHITASLRSWNRAQAAATHAMRGARFPYRSARQGNRRGPGYASKPSQVLGAACEPRISRTPLRVARCRIDGWGGGFADAGAPRRAWGKDCASMDAPRARRFATTGMAAALRPSPWATSRRRIPQRGEWAGTSEAHPASGGERRVC